MFKPFLDSKAEPGTDNKVINPEHNGSIIQDQTNIANCLVDYFTNVANDICDPHSLELEEELTDHEKQNEELTDHESVQRT